MEQQQFTAEVDASVDGCFATITRFEQYPEWFSAVERTTVLQRYRNGLAKQVEFHVDMKVKTVRYVLEYAYDKPSQLTWHAVDGDVEGIEGAYLFEKVNTKCTRVTCRQAVALGFWLPGVIRKFAERQALQQSVLEFKTAAEAAAREHKSPRRNRKD